MRRFRASSSSRPNRWTSRSRRCQEHRGAVRTGGQPRLRPADLVQESQLVSPGRNAAMKINGQVAKILANYESDNPGTKANLARMLMHGKLGGTGKMVILPVDQGNEHGPARSFAPNPPAYDPHYHFQLAIEAGLSAYAAPLGFIEAGAGTYAGQIPLILKTNSANSLS